IAELSTNVARLETRLHEESSERRRTEEDLSVVRDLCTKLDGQKEGLMSQLTQNDLVKMQLETELARLRDEQEILQEQSARDHQAIETLENLLSSCQQETFDQKVTSQSTQKEVDSLRRKITELQDKLNTATTDLQKYQQQATEYSQNVAELQRTITNERFERAREEESRRQNAQNSVVFSPMAPIPFSPLPSQSLQNPPVSEVEFRRTSKVPSSLQNPPVSEVEFRRASKVPSSLQNPPVSEAEFRRTSKVSKVPSLLQNPPVSEAEFRRTSKVPSSLQNPPVSEVEFRRTSKVPSSLQNPPVSEVEFRRTSKVPSSLQNPPVSEAEFRRTSKVPSSLQNPPVSEAEFRRTSKVPSSLQNPPVSEVEFRRTSKVSSSLQNPPVSEIEFRSTSKVPSSTLSMSQKYQELIEKVPPEPSAPPLSPSTSKTQTSIERSIDVNEPIPTTRRESFRKKLPSVSISPPRLDVPSPSSPLPSRYEPIAQSNYDNLLPIHVNVSIGDPLYTPATYSTDICTSVYTFPHKRFYPTNEYKYSSNVPTTRMTSMSGAGTNLSTCTSTLQATNMPITTSSPEIEPMSTTTGDMNNIYPGKRSVSIVEPLPSVSLTNGADPDPTSQRRKSSISKGSGYLPSTVIIKERSVKEPEFSSKTGIGVLPFSDAPGEFLSTAANASSTFQPQTEVITEEFLPTTANASSTFQPQTPVTTVCSESAIIKPYGDTVYATFTSAGSPILSYTANYNVVRQNGVNETTKTTLSIKNSRVYFDTDIDPTSQRRISTIPQSTERRASKYDTASFGSRNVQNIASERASLSERTSSRVGKQNKDRCVPSCSRNKQTREPSTNVESPWFTSDKLRKYKEKSDSSAQKQQNQTKPYTSYSSVESSKSLKPEDRIPSVTDIQVSYAHLISSSEKEKKVSASSPGLLHQT
ncbi:hypothetical protein L9F63_015439, partial [Diploptera punctata]